MNDEDANGSVVQAVAIVADVSLFSIKFECVADMIRNFLTVGFRNLRQQPFYTVLNILGLAVGITCMLLAMLYLGHQLSFDRHHEKSDRIYRVIRKLLDTSGERYDLGTKPVAPHLRGRFPEVEAVTRMLIRRMWASHEEGGSDAAVDPSSPRRIPQDGMFGERPACYSERRRSGQAGPTLATEF